MERRVQERCQRWIEANQAMPAGVPTLHHITNNLSIDNKNIQQFIANPPEKNLNLHKNMTSPTPQHLYSDTNVLEPQDSIGFLSNFTGEYGTSLGMIEDPEIPTKIGVRFQGSANPNTQCDTTARFYAVKVQVKKGKEEPTTQIFCVQEWINANAFCALLRLTDELDLINIIFKTSDILK